MANDLGNLLIPGDQSQANSYSLDFDLKIRSGQVWLSGAGLFNSPINSAPNNLLKIPINTGFINFFFLQATFKLSTVSVPIIELVIGFNNQANFNQDMLLNGTC